MTSKFAVLVTITTAAQHFSKLILFTILIFMSQNSEEFELR